MTTDFQEAFANETVQARQIAIERPARWEYLLTAELLESKLAQIRSKFYSLLRGEANEPPTLVPGDEFVIWVEFALQTMLSLYKQLPNIFSEELVPSCGTAGKAGNPIQIKQAVDRIVSCCNVLMDLDADLYSKTPPESFTALSEQLKIMMSDVLTNYLAELERVVKELKTPGEGLRKIILNFSIQDATVQKMKHVLLGLIDRSRLTTSLSNSVTFSSTLQKGMQFEELCLYVVHQLGFDAETTKPTSDGGIDIVAIDSRPITAGKYIIQCKAWSQSVGEHIVRELFGVVHSERANKGILITTSNFTRSAIEFAKDKPLELIDGSQFDKLLEQYRLDA